MVSTAIRKVLAFIVGFVGGWFPPELITILMEPPPGTWTSRDSADRDVVRRHPTSDVGRYRMGERSRRRRSLRRRTIPVRTGHGVSGGPMPPIPRG